MTPFVDDRQARIAQLVKLHLRGALAGTEADEHQLIVAHGELLPELEHELRKARLVQAAYAQAAAANSPNQVDDTPIDGQSTRHGRLRIRCPHCHGINEFDPDDSLENLSCCGCRCQFSVLGERDDFVSQPRCVAHFLLLERLGGGGFGAVWKARDTQLDRLVAVKLPHRSRMGAEESELFFREARAAAQLRHQSIVSVYEVGRTEESIYIVSELVEGISLADWLKDGRLSAPESAELCRDLAAALDHAHARGVIHRDLKPANIILDANLRPHLTDFGLARRELGELTMTVDGQLVGTPAYMSPEQARGDAHQCDARSDVYGLGVILYELLTGVLPFRDQSSLLVTQITRDEPIRPRQLRAAIPRDLETITLKCLEKEPARRYPSAAELHDDLQRFLRGQPILARPVGRPGRAWRWCRRNKTVASLLGTVGALLLVLATGGPLAAVKQARLARQAQDELNAKNINQLYQDWFSGNVERVKEELKRHYATVDADEYLFEWELLRQMYDDSRKTVLFENARRNAKGETGFLKMVKFSPDGRWLACGQKGDRISIYDMDRKTFRQLDNEPAGDGAAGVAFTPDSRQLITVSWTGVINCRDVATSRVVGPVIECRIENERVSWWNRFRLSPDGTIAVVGMDSGVLALARLREGTCTRIPAHNAEVLAIAFSPDGSTLVTSGPDQSIKFWDVKTNELVRSEPTGSYILDIMYISDGRRLVVSDASHGIRILDAETLEELRGLRGEPQHVAKVALYRDEYLATVGGDDRIVLWDMESGARLATLVGHEGDVREMAFSQDGKSLASSAVDGTLRLWPVGQIIHEAKERIASSQSWKTDLQFAADGNKLVACSRPYLAPVGAISATVMKEWSQATGLSETIVEEGTHGRCDLAIVPATDHLLCGGPGSLAVKDRRSGELIRLLDDDPTHEYQHVAVSPDGKWAAGCGHILDRPRETEYFALIPRGNVCFVAVYNLESTEKEFFPLPADTDTWIICSIVFSPDSKLLVTGGGDGQQLQRVDIFERTGDSFRHLDPREVTGGSAVQDVAFSADSRLLGTAAHIGYGHIWSLGGSKLEATIYRKNGLNTLAFSPDGRILALGDPSGIQLCDLQSQSPLATIPIGSGICDLQFSPDGRTLAWASVDGRVEFLRTTPRAPTTSEPIDSGHAVTDLGSQPARPRN